MELKQALDIASRYVGKEGPQACVVLAKGWVRATNTYRGIAIPVPDLAIDLAVDCAALLKMVKALGTDAKLTMTKGRKLTIRGGGSRYTLQAIPATQNPMMPDEPTTWNALTEEQVRALTALATCAKGVDGAMSSVPMVHFAEGWTGAMVGQGEALVVAWTGLVTEAVTAPPDVFAKLAGTGALAVVDRKLWVREDGTDILRWVRCVDIPWPAASVQQAIATARTLPNRAIAQLDLRDLAAVCKQAHAIAETKADACILTVTDKITLEGGQGGGAHGARDFTGEVACDRHGGANARVGVSAPRLGLAAAAVGVVPGDKYMSAGTPNEPMLLWGGDDVVIEALVLPVYLPT